MEEPKKITVTILLFGEGEIILDDLFPNGTKGMTSIGGVDHDAIKVGDYVICVPAIKQ